MTELVYFLQSINFYSTKKKISNFILNPGSIAHKSKTRAADKNPIKKTTTEIRDFSHLTRVEKCQEGE